MRFIASFVGSLFYLVACAVVLVFVSTPLSIVGAAIGLVAGGLLVLALAAMVLTGGPSAVTEIRTPAQVAIGALGGRIEERFVRRDRAWPQYFVAQVWLDTTEILRRVGEAVSVMWRKPAVWAKEQGLLVWWPLYGPIAAAQIAASVGVAIGVIATLALVVGVTVVAWVVGVLAVILLRLADRGWQTAVQAEGSCQHCFYVSDIPAYRCLGAHHRSDQVSGYDLHRDLRPGKLGVLWRRCACGRRLPTTVFRAGLGNRAQACCPRCTEPLPAGSGVYTDVRVPVFGAASAGKTQLIMAALVTLRRLGEHRGVRVSGAEPASARVYDEYAAQVDAGLPAAKTSAGSPPVAVTLRLATRTRRALLHVFDAAGELLVDRKQNDRLSYLDYGRSLLFVLDPFSIRAVRDEFSASFAEVFSEANAAMHDPEDSYNATVMRLQEYGVRTERKRLAFVVSKTDLLDKLPVGLSGTSSEDVRAWLVEQGLGNLVTAAVRDFGAVRFFAVSGRSLTASGALAPLHWLLVKEWRRVV